jgi:hypothetical protein
MSSIKTNKIDAGFSKLPLHKMENQNVPDAREYGPGKMALKKADGSIEVNREDRLPSNLSEAVDKLQKPSSILGRTGGAYIPPARLAMMQKEITDKASDAYQRVSWEALKKSINGLINKVVIN